MNFEMIREHTSRLSFRIICGLVILLFLFGTILSFAGYEGFAASLMIEYSKAAYRTAETAAEMVDGNMIDYYLETSGTGEDYALMNERLYTLCQKQDVTLIYVIKPDTDDYDTFTSVVNVANENSDYDEWPVGYRRKTTNEEYRETYRDIYENGLDCGIIERTDYLRGREAHITSLVPVKDDTGDVKAILCVQRSMDALTAGMRSFKLYIAGVTAVVVFLSSLIVYLYLRKHFVRPMKAVTREAERFARENNEADIKDLTNISTISEIDTLARSIGQMERGILDYIDRITKITAENKRIVTELEIARNIQAAVLPKEFPAFPERCDFDIYASMTPAKEVGGDFYDFFLIDEDHLGLVIADVSGKGVPAALFMMIAKLLIKLRVKAGGNPGKMLSDVNNTLCEKNEMEMFVTAWLAVITLSNGNGVAVNAGHEYPALRRTGGRYELLKYKHGMPLAAMEGMVFREHEFHLDPGDSILVYTDGVTEATNINNEMFGEKRLIEALNKKPDASPDICIANVKRSIDDFTGEAEQFDDITMLGIRYNGK